MQSRVPLGSGKFHVVVLVIVSNGNRTEWSPIRSGIIRVITKSDDRAAGVRFVYHEFDYRPELDDTKSYYQLIIKITISEKRRIAKLYKCCFDNIPNGFIGCQVTSEKQVLCQSKTQPCMKNTQLRRTLQKLVKIPAKLQNTRPTYLHLIE